MRNSRVRSKLRDDFLILTRYHIMSADNICDLHAVTLAQYPFEKNPGAAPNRALKYFVALSYSVDILSRGTVYIDPGETDSVLCHFEPNYTLILNSTNLNLQCPWPEFASTVAQTRISPRSDLRLRLPEIPKGRLCCKMTLFTAFFFTNST